MINIDTNTVCSIYKRNFVTLKKYSDTVYKVTYFKTPVRRSGYEREDDFYSSKGSVNDQKLDVNISRARSKIFGYAMCNPWEYFTTFTINKTKFNRFDLGKYHKSFTQWIRDYNKKHGTSIKYLTIPEQHKNGAWHEHGFIMGLPIDHLLPFTLDQKLPDYIRKKLKDGQAVYNWPAYAQKFGFVDFEPIRSVEAASKYVTKYISKNLDQSVKEINAHLYYNSNGLKEPVIINEGTPLAGGIPSSWENDYVSIMWIKDGDLSKLDSIIQWD